MRHRTHHGISFIAGIILSTVLSEALKMYMPVFARVNVRLAAWLRTIFSLRIDQYLLEFMILAFFIAFLYGLGRDIFDRSQG